MNKTELIYHDRLKMGRGESGERGWREGNASIAGRKQDGQQLQFNNHVLHKEYDGETW